MIYVFHDVDANEYKIGQARDESSARKQRLPQSRSKREKMLGRPVRVEFICWRAWPPELEMDIHRYLWQSWLADEWFKDSPESRTVVEWLLRDDYYNFRRSFRATEATLPGRWHWKNRDRILAKHKAAQQGQGTRASQGI